MIFKSPCILIFIFIFVSIVTVMCQVITTIVRYLLESRARTVIVSCVREWRLLCLFTRHSLTLI